MFSKSIKLPFKMAGIPLYLDFSFLLILPIMAWLIASRVGMWTQLWHIPNPASLHTGAMPYVLGLVAAVGLFVCVVLHELGHALTARAFGIRTRSITLWFLGGVARLEGIPRQRGAEAVVAIVGPLVSFSLAILFLIPLFFLPLPPALTFIFAYLATTNFSLAIFNLAPAIPLDGGRVLRSLLALFMSYTAATRAAATVSKIIAILMGILGLYTGQFFLIFIAIFVYMAGSAETRATVIEDILKGTHVSDVMNPQFQGIMPHAPVEQIALFMRQQRLSTLPVIDDAGNLLGIVSYGQLAGRPPTATAAEIMSRETPTVAPGEDAFTAVKRMNESGLETLPVIDAAKHLLGLINAADLARLLQFRAGRVRAQPAT